MVSEGLKFRKKIEEVDTSFNVNYNSYKTCVIYLFQADVPFLFSPEKFENIGCMMFERR